MAYVDHDNTKRIIGVKLHLVHTLLKSNGYTTNRVNVAEHELGHAMGLAHNPSKQSVMYKTTRYVSVQPIDVKNVRNLYSIPASQYFINSPATTSNIANEIDYESSGGIVYLRLPLNQRRWYRYW